MKFELTEKQLNNLMIFLDRVEYKGLNELSAINEILNILNSPIRNDVKTK